MSSEERSCGGCYYFAVIPTMGRFCRNPQHAKFILGDGCQGRDFEPFYATVNPKKFKRVPLPEIDRKIIIPNREG